MLQGVMQIFPVDAPYNFRNYTEENHPLTELKKAKRYVT